MAVLQSASPCFSLTTLGRVGPAGGRSPDNSRPVSRVSSGAASLSGESIQSGRSVGSHSVASTSASSFRSRTSSVASERGKHFRVAACSGLREFSQTRGRLAEDTKPKPKITREELERDLLGLNGDYRKQRAPHRLEEYEDEQKLKEQQRVAKEEEQKRKVEEKEEWYRQKVELQRRELEEWEHARDAKERAKELKSNWIRLAHSVIEADDEELKRLQDPKQCERCTGKGICTSCDGRGCHNAIYLSPSVGQQQNGVVQSDGRFHGRSTYGCNECGGNRDGREAHGKEAASKGTGRCLDCHGLGQTWPTLTDATNHREQERRKQRQVASGEVPAPPTAAAAAPVEVPELSVVVQKAFGVVDHGPLKLSPW